MRGLNRLDRTLPNIDFFDPVEQARVFLWRHGLRSLIRLLQNGSIHAFLQWEAAFPPR
jgi:hypothetical protein